MVIAKSFIPEGSFSLSIYHQLFAEKSGLIVDSILCALVATGLTLVFAFAIALYVAFCATRFKRFILAALMLTMISPPFVSSLAYIMLFGKRGLIVHHLLGLSWNPYGMHGVIFMQVFGNISLAILLIVGMFALFDPLLLEAYLAVIGRANMSLAAGISVIILIPSLFAFFFYRHFIHQSHGASIALQKIGTKGLPGLTLSRATSRLLGALT